MTAASNVLFNTQSICVITQADINQLKQLACASQLKRARLCMHLSQKDAIQEMVIALHKDTYIAPHIHHGKIESFHVIEGELLVSFFDNSGEITRILHLGANKEGYFMYRMCQAEWHSVLPLSDVAVIHEIVSGPFEPCDHPLWMPQEDLVSIQNFKQQILNTFYGRK